MDCRRDVPEAVLFDILLLLPVVSLLRFKTVCKSWCSIIESCSFIRQQLNNNSEKNNLIVHNLNVQNMKDEVYILSGRKHEVCVKLNLEGIDPGFFIVGSYNGIICLGYEHSSRYWRLSLWNPATKQVRKLPEMSYFSPGETLIINVFALGFDIKTNDYKIVSISLDEHEKTLNDSIVQVYNMRTDSWRTIHEGGDFPVRWIDELTDPACKNEMCLWIGVSSIENTRVIFYFDLTEEAYGTIPLPDDHKSNMDRSLNFFEDKITYMELNYGARNCRYYEIWRMDEFGIKESWNKLYKLKEPILPSQVTVWFYLSKDEDFILAMKDGEGVLCESYVYYFATAEVKKLDVPARYFYSYMESTVSIKSGDGIS